MNQQDGRVTLLILGILMALGGPVQAGRELKQADTCPDVQGFKVQPGMRNPGGDLAILNQDFTLEGVGQACQRDCSCQGFVTQTSPGQPSTLKTSLNNQVAEDGFCLYARKLTCEEECNCLPFFVYKNVTYTTCTSVDGGKPWCIIYEECPDNAQRTQNSNPPNLKWKYCDALTPQPASASSAPAPAPAPAPTAPGGQAVAGDASTTTASSGGSGGGGSNSSKVVGIAVSVAGLLALIALSGIICWMRNKRNKLGTYPRDTDAQLYPGSHSDLMAGGKQVASDHSSSHFSALSQSSGTFNNPDIPDLSEVEAAMLAVNKYSWCKGLPTPHRAVESGVNDTELDSHRTMTATGTACPVLRLSAQQVQEQIHIIETGLVGKGGAAAVFNCKWPVRFGPSAVLAIKIMKRTPGADEVLLASFAYEANLLASIRHPNVIRTYGYCLDAPCVCIIMELLPLSLKQRLASSSLVSSAAAAAPAPAGLRTPPAAPLSVLRCLQICAGVASGLAALHNQDVPNNDNTGMSLVSDVTTNKIVHRDLKPDNILLDSAGRARITDFGLAREHREDSSVHTVHMGAGTLRYLAPELLLGWSAGQGSGRITNKVDIYALGMVAHECATGQVVWNHLLLPGEKWVPPDRIKLTLAQKGRPPLPALDTKSSADQVADLALLPATLDNMPAGFAAIIRQCWHQDPQARPGAAEVHEAIGALLKEHGHTLINQSSNARTAR